MSVRRCLSVVMLAAGMLAVSVSLASADPPTRQVTSTSDAGPGSLRDTIASADPGDIVRIPAGTYTLSSQITISKPLTLIGDGARRTVIDGGGTTRLFEITPQAAGPYMWIARVTLTHGAATAGGAVKAEGQLSLIEDSIVNNTATAGSGGGVFSNARLEVTRSLVAYNDAPNGSGGGVEFAPADAVANEVATSTIVFNRARDNGAGVDESTAQNETLALYDDTFDENTLTSALSVGGNLFVPHGTVMDLHSNVFAGGSASFGTDCMASGSLAPGSENNVEDGDGGCIMFNPNDRRLDPSEIRLGDLDNYGGQTDTMMPLGDSALIDDGDAQWCSLVTDQRGVPRPRGGSCDIGAVEVGSQQSAGTPSVSDITATTAKLTATANPDYLGGSFDFVYGIGSASGQTTSAQQLVDQTADQPAVATLTNLTPATTYHVKLEVFTGLGLVRSSDVTFTTAPVSGAPK